MLHENARERERETSPIGDPIKIAHGWSDPLHSTEGEEGEGGSARGSLQFPPMNGVWMTREGLQSSDFYEELLRGRQYLRIRVGFGQRRHP